MADLDNTLSALADPTRRRVVDLLRVRPLRPAELARPRSFQRWALDLASPGLLRTLRKKTHAQFSEGVAPLQFAPEDGPSFFTGHGWNPIDVRSILKTAARLKRVSRFMRLLSHLPENPARMGSRPWSGVCLLAKG